MTDPDRFRLLFLDFEEKYRTAGECASALSVIA